MSTKYFWHLYEIANTCLKRASHLQTNLGQSWTDRHSTHTLMLVFPISFNQYSNSLSRSPSFKGRFYCWCESCHSTRRQKILSEICSNTEVVELLPPWTESLRAPGYDQHHSHQPGASKAVLKPCPHPATAHFGACCTVTATEQRGDPLSQPHTSMPCVRKGNSREKGHQERPRGNERAASPSQAQGWGITKHCLLFANLLGRNKWLWPHPWLQDYWSLREWLGKAQQGLAESVSSHHGHEFLPGHMGGWVMGGGLAMGLHIEVIFHMKYYSKAKGRWKWND